MPEIQERLARHTVEMLRKRGIEILLETTIERVTDRSVTLSTGEEVPCRTVVWTAGVKANPVAERLRLPLDQGRITCTEEMRVTGYDNVWALGDIAAIPDPARPGLPCPPTAQHAIRQGKLMGRNVAAALGHRRQVKPFRFRTLGSFADLGRHNAVANIMGLGLRGFPAWAIDRFYHLAWMPGIRRKAQLIRDWNIGLLFRHDTAELGQLGHPPALDESVAPGGVVPESSVQA
jgi:NADH dehydrogenase